MITRLRTATNALQAELTELYSRTDEEEGGTAGKGPFGAWMVRIKPSRAEEIIEVRCAVVGNVDSGKSTLTGVLTRGGLDDGRGKVGLGV